MEGADLGRVARDQCRRDELGELQDRQLLGMLAQRAGLVEDAGALALGLAEQVGGVEELGVEGRVLAHQHGADVGQGDIGRGGDAVPVVRVAGELDFDRRSCADPAAALPDELARLAGQQRVAAAGGLTHHREGRVLVGLEGVQRVGNEEQLHGRAQEGCRAGQCCTGARSVPNVWAQRGLCGLGQLAPVLAPLAGPRPVLGGHPFNRFDHGRHRHLHRMAADRPAAEAGPEIVVGVPEAARVRRLVGDLAAIPHAGDALLPEGLDQPMQCRQHKVRRRVLGEVRPEALHGRRVGAQRLVAGREQQRAMAGLGPETAGADPGEGELMQRVGRAKQHQAERAFVAFAGIAAQADLVARRVAPQAQTLAVQRGQCLGRQAGLFKAEVVQRAGDPGGHDQTSRQEMPMAGEEGRVRLTLGRHQPRKRRDREQPGQRTVLTQHAAAADQHPHPVRQALGECLLPGMAGDAAQQPHAAGRRRAGAVGEGKRNQGASSRQPPTVY
mmetsp:Transcript_21599/g.51232  ORF Transcript_21599/g.51232 Transcript_21599/m.51232 type:complete len:499 (-) Transcript_21599:3260-4756(-)